jgi:hypothetical protein
MRCKALRAGRRQIPEIYLKNQLCNCGPNIHLSCLHVGSNHAAKVLLQYGIEGKNMLIECLWVEQSNAAAVFVGLPHLSGSSSAFRVVSLPLAIFIACYVQVLSKLNVMLESKNQINKNNGKF